MPNAKLILRSDPELPRINEARKRYGMPLLPTDEQLNESLKAAGFKTCEGRPYPWADDQP